MIKESRIGSLPDGKYRVYSKSGKNLGTYNSYGAAKKRLAEVEMFKHMDKSKKKKRRKSAIIDLFSTMKEAAETTTTYSAIMRDLRKNDPDKVKLFMKSFKKAFDDANEQKLDDIESVALLQAMQDVDYKEKSDDDS